MSAEYSIHVEPPRDLVHIRMGGFFTAEDIEAFLRVRKEAHKSLTCRRNAHVTVNDIRDMKIQSQEIVDAFRAMLAAPYYRSRRLAFVVGPTLARTQVMRALDRREARCFKDMASAEAWLFADDTAVESSDGEWVINGGSAQAFREGPAPGTRFTLQA